ncbi:fused MFS/spermidine synthase [Candidatus Omnitrophota bacterium]
MKKSIVLAAFLIGFTALTAQIVFLRQLIVVFYGNEVCLGFLLGAWLFWGALGSWLGRFADRVKRGELLFAVLETVLSVVLIATILAIRRAGDLLAVLPGEIIGFLPMAGFSFLAVSLTCLILGFLFTLACKIFPQQKLQVTKIGWVYILEAAGAVCGGCLTSFLLIRYFDGFYIILGLAGLNLICAYWLARGLAPSRSLRLSQAVNLILIALILGLFFSQGAEQINDASIARQWRKFDLLKTKDSVYSNLAVTRRDAEYSFFANGLYMFTVPDAAASEEAVHFALLETPRPRRVLLIGGGLAGLAAEILKHPVAKLDYVELDPEVITLGKDLLPASYTEFLEDRRVNLFHQDGRLFVQRAGLKPDFQPYDSVIMFLGDPYTAQINRFYTREFFQQVQQILAPEGVFSFGLSSAENFINREQRQFLSSIQKTLSAVFSEVKMIPGDTVYFLAAEESGILTYDYKQLLKRLEQRGINTRYVREYYLFAKLSADRIAYLEQSLAAEQKPQINRDFRPISYYYDMVLWSTYFNQPWRSLFVKLKPEMLWGYFGCGYLTVFLFALWTKSRRNGKFKATLLAVSTTGLTELSFQVVIMLAFQIIYGYLYYKLGVILSFFMVGLLLGSWLITRRLESLTDDYGLLLKTQVAIAFYPLILPLVFVGLRQATANPNLSWWGSNIVFAILPVISGFIGGVQFPLANKIMLKDNSALGRIAGLTRGLDLFGSFLGAVLVSAILVPLLGITQTCIAIALLNTFVLAALLINRTRS